MMNPSVTFDLFCMFIGWGWGLGEGSVFSVS